MQNVTFTSWTPKLGNGKVYKATFYTALAGDADAYNDTLARSFNTYSAQRMVLVQDFTAQWCGYCPYVQNAMQQLKAEAKDSIWVVGVHPSSSSDSFYTLHSKDLETFYGTITGYPTTVWDGKEQLVGGYTGSYTDARAMFNSHKALKAPFTMTLTGTRMPDGTSGNIRATLSYPGGAPFTANITMAIVEESKYCVWPSATANPKCDSMRDFIRDMFPSSLGDAITIPAGKGTLIKNIPFTNATGWNKPRLDYIVWVYNSSTKEIYNAGGIGYAALTPNAVELSSFTAMAGNGSVTLQWQTASETDNYAWLVDRSTSADEGFARITEIATGNNPNGHAYSYTDKTAAPLTDYYYRLGDQDLQGNVTWHGPIMVTGKGEMITSVSLAPCRPNPCRSDVSISYALPKAGEVTLNVYDVSGRLVRTLESGTKNAGSQQTPWDLRDNSGRTVSNGIYVYRLIAGAQTRTQKLTVIR
jgi:thiol-disulfide isomerase/thioredoxin